METLSVDHLLGIKDLTKADIDLIFSTADEFKDVINRPIKKVPSLRDITIANLFFENSTRTKLSFELAEKRLSADVINFASGSSSVKKGETLVDTVNNILSMKVEGIRGDYFSLLLLAAAGMCVVASASDIITIILGLELMSIPTYVLTGYSRGRFVSAEASLKFVVFGLFSTAVMLYGFSLLYAFTGKTNIYDIHQILSYMTYYQPALFISFIFIITGIGFRIAFVPFHVWFADVVEGASVPVSAFIATGPITAGFALLIRFLFVIFAEPGAIPFEHWIPVGITVWPVLAGVIAIATMTVGNLAAMNQSNIKRLMAYSTIAQSGYLLMGVVSATGEGLKALMFYLVIFLFMNLGAFSVIEMMKRFAGLETITDYRGMGRHVPFLSFAMTIFLFSLAGIPPLSGFIGKFYLFTSLLEQKIYWLVMAALLNSIFSLYYYLKIVKAMFFEEAKMQYVVKTPVMIIVLTAIFLVPTLFLGLYSEPLFNWIEISLHFLSVPEKLIW